MRDNITPDELGDLLRQIGFVAKAVEGDEYRLFTHPAGAIVVIPPDDENFVSASTINGCRFTLDQFGLMTADEFDRRIEGRKVG